MAGLPNPPGFGSHRWGEVSWAQHHSTVNPRFLVKDSGSWQPTISTSLARTIDIAAGSAQACGVYDVTDAPESITFAANTGTSDRYDYFVARFDWSSRTRVFTVIQGTPNAPAVNRTGSAVIAGQANWIPGVRYDALLGWVRIRPNANLLQPGDISDLRMWGGGSGPLVTNTLTNMALLDVPPYAEVVSTFNSNVFRRNNETTNYTNITATEASSLQRFTLPPVGGWLPATNTPATYWKDDNGTVWLMGGFNNQNAYIALGYLVAVMPAGYRPAKMVDFIVLTNYDNVYVSGTIDSTGRLQVNRGTTMIPENRYHSFYVFYPAA
jgi:hypothetical protein